MNSIKDLYERYKNVKLGALGSDDKFEMRESLRTFLPEDLRTIEEHKMYIEVLSKLRQIVAIDLDLAGTNFYDRLESLFSVGEDGLYSNSHRFIYELIQNVDDCEYDDITNCNLEVQFCYNMDPAKIIFTYNEKGFRPLDVFGITGIGEDIKNISVEKVEIGEKGIGFKSVFGIADKVSIESGMFSFEIYKDNFTVPIPHYENFTPVEGTVLTLEMSSELCVEIYRSLVEQYSDKEALLNKNPILFLNKLTHLKFYFDGFRYIEFDVARKEKPACRNGLFFDDSIDVSMDMKDSHKSNDIAISHIISCYRYIMPVTYGRDECISRYGADWAKKNEARGRCIERRHSLIAVFPKLHDNGKFKGLLYSFLPTQIKTTVPIILHVPYKLDSSREYVDPQKKNKWFTFTSEQLSFFLKQVYLDFSRVVKEEIIAYIPNKKSYFFEKDNDKIECLCMPNLQGTEILNQKIFPTTDGSYENSSSIISFIRSDLSRDIEAAYRILNPEKKLFIPPYEIDMRWYDVEVIDNILSLLFKKGMREDSLLQEVLCWIKINCENVDYKALIDECESITLDSNKLEIISNDIELSSTFLASVVHDIKMQKTSKILLNTDNLIFDVASKNIILDAIEANDLTPPFVNYLDRIGNKIYALAKAKGDFVIAGKNGIVLSESNYLASFARLSQYFDKRKTFSASLQIRNASEQLNKVDESISNLEYLHLLRGVRQSMKNAFGPQLYSRYINLIRDSGINADKSRFLKELLQNADDCSYTKSKSTPHFNLSMENNFLRVSYNEDGFTKNNVRAITAIGESTKKLLLNDDVNSIGEKGIGFKSVFEVATSVEIHSNGFHFKLTETAPTVPDKCKNVPIDEGTCMLFKMKYNIASYFTSGIILKLCRCLRNLKELNLLGYQVRITDDDRYRTIEIDDKIYRYEKFIYNFTISDNNILEERNSYCKNISCNQQIYCYIPESVKEENCLLYSGLYTDIKSNVPLIIDAPFELTTSREQVLHNNWNDCIRANMYHAILNLMEQKKDSGLDILRYVGFKTVNGIITWKNFDNEYLNFFNWRHELGKRRLLPVLGKEERVSPFEQNTIIIPDFIAQLYKHKNLNDLFAGIIIDTKGKSQYVPLLEAIGCRKVRGHEMFRCLEKIIGTFITGASFRNGLYAYLSGNQGNVSFDSIGKGVKRIPIIPVRKYNGTSFICYNDNIYSHKNEISKDDYYVLDDEILPIDILHKIFGEGGRIRELSEEVFDAKYRNNLELIICGNSSLSDKAKYLLNEFKTHPNEFKKCEYSLKGLIDKIPFQMKNGEYKDGNKFVNSKNQFFAGPLLLKFTVSDKYEEIAKFLGCNDILEIHYDDFDYEIELVEDDDLEDLEYNFVNYAEIIGGLIDDGLITDEQISKYNLDFAVSTSITNNDDESFPTKSVEDMSIISRHIKAIWNNSRNPYIEKKYVQWKPKLKFNSWEYVYSLYQSKSDSSMCFCQMCKQKTSYKYIECNEIEKEPAYAWKQMYLSLCLNCSKDYIYMRNKEIVWDSFIESLMKINPLTQDKFDVPILNDKTVTFTAAHIAAVQEIFKTQGWGKNAPIRKIKLGSSTHSYIEPEEEE